MNSDSKYRMFKNFMYNELGITKEDIRHWTDEAVKETALKFVTNKMSDYDTNDLNLYLRGLIRQEIRPLIKELLKEEVVNIINKKLKITLEIPNDKKATIAPTPKGCIACRNRKQNYDSSTGMNDGGYICNISKALECPKCDYEYFQPWTE